MSSNEHKHDVQKQISMLEADYNAATGKENKKLRQTIRQVTSFLSFIPNETV